ncbi:[Pyruvate dehydrogenase [acetyl-transferring]]-phosphatase 1, mitochondrial [Savitreella phatthalungensis]
MDKALARSLARRYSQFALLLKHVATDRAATNTIVETSATTSRTYATSTRRKVSYQVQAAPKSRSQRQRARFFYTTAASAAAVTLYYLLSAERRILRADSTKNLPVPLLERDQSLRKTDTSIHPRNSRLTVDSPDEANQILRTNELSSRGKRGSGIVAYHFNQVASNSPIEDDHREALVPDPFHSRAIWSFFGVFDGHAGWATSDRLKRDLIPWVSRALRDAGPLEHDIQTAPYAISRAFTQLDDHLVKDSLRNVLEDKSMPTAAAYQALLPAMHGSCALLSFYDPASRMLHVAGTGDARAIWCHRTPDGTSWAIKQLSLDQTGRTPSEAARLRREHPDEPHVVANGRVLGRLEPTRAFGDARFKWTVEEQQKARKLAYAQAIPKGVRSPPYVTAEPIILSQRIPDGSAASQGFVVMATDGLWELLTNDEICTLVTDWREKHLDRCCPAGDEQALRGSAKSSWVPAFLRESFGVGGATTKILHEKGAESIHPEDSAAQKTPDEDDDSPTPASGKKGKQFTCVDDNVSTHLIRNALGGADHNKLSGLLSLQYPISRSHRDDISVTVVFFGDEDQMAKL